MLMDLDELVDHWTLLTDERELVAGKRGPTRLGFALLLKFYARAGRFPRGRAELDDDAVAFVARQVGVPASDLGLACDEDWYRILNADGADRRVARCRVLKRRSGCPQPRPSRAASGASGKPNDTVAERPPSGPATPATRSARTDP
jgi:hypothetical protein